MNHYLAQILPGVKYTLLITVAAFFLGAAAGVPIALVRRSRHLLPRLLARFLVDLLRAVPPITWLFLIFYGLPSAHITLNPIPAAIIGLGLLAAAYLSEIYRAGLIAVSRGQWEAANALGLSQRDVLTNVIAPQAIRVIGPPAATYAIGLLKDSAIASTIGVGEITFRATTAVTESGHGLALLSIVAVIYLLLSLPLAVVSRHVDRRLRVRFEMG